LPKPTKIQVDQITLDERVKPRDEINQQAVDDYSAAMLEGAKFPPIVVFKYTDGTIRLAHGFHRYNAALQAGIKEILADVRKGGIHDVIRYAAGANKDQGEQGVRLTNKDKRASVLMLLRDEECAKLSQVRIAEIVGCSNATVSRIKEDLQSKASTVTGRDGKVYPATREKPESDRSSFDDGGFDDEAAARDHRLIKCEAEQPPDPAECGPTPKFNHADEDSIEWAAWSWNPVTGCKHGCPYCYARDIATRFFPERFEPTFRRERLAAPENTPFPKEIKNVRDRCVFVVDMGDLFGEWVPAEWIQEVLAACKAGDPRWTYLFLTKNPARYAEFEFPKNAWLGATVDSQNRVKPTTDAFAALDGSAVRWLSCEPLTEPLALGGSLLSLCDWIIMGGYGGGTRGKAISEARWRTELIREVGDAKIGLYEKPNIVRLKEYPHA
jgi:protein gp37/ParB-like chromosome segregation protein Spo0J